MVSNRVLVELHSLSLTLVNYDHSVSIYFIRFVFDVHMFKHLVGCCLTLIDSCVCVSSLFV